MFGLFDFLQNFFVSPDKAKAHSEVSKLRTIVNDLKRKNGDGQPTLRPDPAAQVILNAVEPDLKNAEDALVRGDNAKALEYAHLGIVRFENIY